MSKNSKIWRFFKKIYYFRFSSRAWTPTRSFITTGHHIFQSSRRRTKPRRGWNRRPQKNSIRHFRPCRRSGTRMEYRRPNRHVVAAKFRTRPIPLYPAPYYQTQRTEEIIFGPITRTGIFCRSTQLQIGRRSLIWVVWQRSGVRAHHFNAATGFGPI